MVGGVMLEKWVHTCATTIHHTVQEIATIEHHAATKRPWKPVAKHHGARL